MAMGHFGWFFGICFSCLAFGHSGLFLVGGILILVAGLVTPMAGTAIAGAEHHMYSPFGFRWFPMKVNIGKGSILANTYVAFINLFRPGTYFLLVSFFLRIIKFLINARGEKFNYWSAFKRISVFYLIAVPYPAAFLAPVGYKQADPNLQLMIGGMLFMLVNILGDLLSSRITVSNFSNVLKLFRDADQVDIDQHFFQGVKFELAIYLTTLRDLAAALFVLCLVLILSNVLFGIQVGLYTFSTDLSTLGMMWDRAVHFYDIAHELYWFRGPNGMPPQGVGVPGMFIYGTTTFLPTLIMLFFSILWTLTLPLRIILQMPRSKLFRIITAELSVFAICVTLSMVFDFRIQTIYSFLTAI